ncbi:hypothetical protein Emag_007052 [Eimeria magna]
MELVSDRMRRLALGAVASAAAVAVLIALCAAAYLQAAPLQLTKRRLSEGGAPSESAAGSAACGQTSGNGSGEHLQGSLQEEEVGSQPAKKAKVESEGFEADNEAGSQHQASRSGQEASPIAAGGAAASASEAESPAVPCISTEEVIAAHALIALWGSLAPASQQQAQLPLVPQPQEQPTAAREQQATQAPPQALASMLEAPPGKPSPGSFLTSRKMYLSSIDGLEVIDPRIEWEPPTSIEPGGLPILEHAFSRLPRVPSGDPSAYSSFFSSQRAISNVGTPAVKVYYLQKVRDLLALEELTVGQMRQLAALAEHVVSHLNLNEGTQLPSCPSYAVETLGFRFLLMEMTVSSLQLLGVPRRGPWWEKTVSRIPDEYDRPFTRWGEKLPSCNFHLMLKLTAAIRVLKTGHRPDPKLVVHLKRCLFCSKNSPLRFLKPGWNHWREDDKVFYQQFEGTPGQSDPVQPGPSHQSSS